MRITKNEWFLIVFNALYVLGFASYYISIKNYEFLWYIAVFLFFFVLIGGTLRRTNFSLPILWGLSLWGLLHMMGGGVPVNGEVLYRFVIVPFFDGGGEYVLLKYDQAVHFFGFFVSTLVVAHLMKKWVSPAAFRSTLFLFFVAMAGVGLSVINELVEFGAVVALGNTGVGGYGNTLLDLVFNTLGALCAAFLVYIKTPKNNL